MITTQVAPNTTTIHEEHVTTNYLVQDARLPFLMDAVRRALLERGSRTGRAPLTRSSLTEVDRVVSSPLGRLTP